MTGALQRLGRWRAEVRSTRSGGLALKAAALVLGVACIGLGVVLIVLPGPLTIPPVLLGLYILSTEFAWADRQFARARVSGRAAWATAKHKPLATALTTAGGLVVAALAVWVLSHYQLVAKAKDAVGL